MNSINDYYVLSNGGKIPCIGFGTWKLPEADTTVDIIKTAIDCGYRHIDTAFMYGNEKSVGKAIRTCGLKRNELFVTSKLSNNSHGYEKTMKEFEMTMENLDIEYLDLYLIHWPRPLAIRDMWKEANEGTWKAFEELYKAGKIKAIGVSNFLETHLEALLETATVAPMVNQLELHPQFVQRDIVEYCKNHRIIVEAYSPLIRGDFSHPVLVETAKKYNKSVAQVLLRWSIQHGFIPLPKASKRERIIENADIFDFQLSDEDIEAMKVLEAKGSIGSHPDTAPF
ncbi:aldo/keto reductase [Herbinix luporum]|jgi:diketogulonate reductase-like aldo/keto reductase|uniref:Glyoxal reductase n=1 Tax=Herbinix luporum TaxID=1679721 RepID=A0A0K8J4N0_9FIRM|nr:aldo/keto reductase [Herbinix luporum]CUH92314.1 Glyoxal reductase [Herbinix luporum]HHT57716.1 aldo/keto reductase [Herbinix luporum]